MATMTKILLVIAFTYIAMVWSGAWTAMLLMVALSAMCLGKAAESWYADQAARRSARKRAAPAGIARG